MGITDLLSGNEEGRYTSALALILELEKDEPRLLRRLLETACETNLSKDTRLGAWRFCHGSELRTESVATEVPCTRPRGSSGRFDLLVRLRVDGKPRVLVVEVKTAADVEHGNQLRTYRDVLRHWHNRGADHADTAGADSAVLCFLLVGEPDAFKAHHHKQIDDAKEEFAHAWTWRDVFAALKQCVQGEKWSPASRELARRLMQDLKEWAMDDQTLTDALGKPSIPPMPVVLDILERLAKRLASPGKPRWEPRGQKGPTWDDEWDWYYCGYAWKGPSGRSFHLWVVWEWDAIPETPDRDLLEVGDLGAWYAFVGLWDGADNELGRWPQSEVARLLTPDGMADIRQHMEGRSR